MEVDDSDWEPSCEDEGWDSDSEPESNDPGCMWLKNQDGERVWPPLGSEAGHTI